jgi:hypothetical protein
MYREPAETEKKEPAPKELALAGVRVTWNRAPYAVLVKLVSLPLIVAGTIAALGSPTGGLIGGVAAAVFGVWRNKKATTSNPYLFRVDGGALRVIGSDGVREIARFDLEELLDVRLEIKTVKMVQEGSSLVPAVRFIETKVADEVDTAKLALVGRDRPPVVLGDEYIAHMDATEQMGKLRVFLRKNGWVPADERPPDSSAPESSAPESSAPETDA